LHRKSHYSKIKNRKKDLSDIMITNGEFGIRP